MEAERPSHGSGHAVKPALRKQPSQPSQHPAHGIVWNEANLAENEKIKASLPQVKINEPKTPFHELLPDDDVDLQPLALDGEAPAEGNGHAVNGSAGPSEVSEEHKKQFAEARRAHYKMKDALAHKPIDDDDDDDDEELPAANGK